ncbi:hypothetical protein EQV77_06820 [Halobacillus fulvus]|nr:hypothetical protein EQV77_06820 [Halobacillus fulvus]
MTIQHHEFKENAEAKILHLLVQALIRENIYKTEKDELGYHLIIADKGQLTVPISHVYQLGHIDLAGDITFRDGKKEHLISSPVELLEKIGFATDDPFLKEIISSVDHYALALEAARKRTRELDDAPDAYTYAEKRKRYEDMFSPLTFFEQWVIEGHTIHPCTRTRIGLSEEEGKAYAPEWGARPELIPVAVRSDASRFTSLDGHTMKDILFKEYPELEKAFHAECPDPERYDLIPVHPWQWEHTIQKRYGDMLADGRIFPIKGAKIKTASLISFRTMAPDQSRTRHHIKTAVNIQMTSAVRTVSAASTHNGPVMSRLLERITSQDPALGDVAIMKDVVGIHFEPDEDKDRNFYQKNLASILRENPEADLGKDEIAIPAATLIARSPFSDQLIMEELIERAGGTPQSFIKTYAEAVLPGLLTLMTKYGISMEAHLQNSVVVFQKGVPKRVILRDNGGIRVMEKRLHTFFREVRIDPSTNVLTEERQELVDMFSHALIHNHFGEMIVALARRNRVDEKVLWNQVKIVIQNTYEQLEKDGTPAESLEDENVLLFRPSRMKALVKMRWSDQSIDNEYVDIDQPFQTEEEVFRP